VTQHDSLAEQLYTRTSRGEHHPVDRTRRGLGLSDLLPNSILNAAAAVGLRADL
jgi:hypothetical protein